MFINAVKQITPPIILKIFYAFKKPFKRTCLFDGDEKVFKEKATTCHVYGEYGCGQSTKWIYINTKVNIYSVDSSQAWANSVVSSINNSSRLKINYIDVGPIGDWGRPITYSKRDKYLDYIYGIWGNELKPDLILIDGRFRVACFFASILQADPGSCIIFDDYMNRPHYHLVEEYIHRDSNDGRQGIFIVPVLQSHERISIEELVKVFSNVMD
jgi:hypothetical protein